MDTTRASNLALELMEKHGLREGHWSSPRFWNFDWFNGRKTLGHCEYYTRTIRLSLPFVRLNPEEAVRNTILHEIAHALAGRGTGHGPLWKAHCRRIGARPERCSTPPVRVPTRYVGRCPAGHELGRHQRPRHDSSCGKCSSRFDPKHLITWSLAS